MAVMALLESVFNHLVLPPKLPAHRDINFEDIQQNILVRLIQGCGTLSKFTGEQLQETWECVRNSLRSGLNINSGRLEKASMLQQFCNLQRNSLLILYVVEQNAALLIRRYTE